MLVRICDICFGNGSKVTKAVGKSSQSFYRNSLKLTADVCDEHKEYLKSMGTGDLPKVIESFELLEKKASKRKGDQHEG